MSTRREFIKTAGLASAGLLLSGLSVSAKSYKRIIGSNDRVNVGIIGFSDRARYTLIPCFMNHYKKQNFDIIGVSDIWKLRRESGVNTLSKLLNHDIRG